MRIGGSTMNLNELRQKIKELEPTKKYYDVCVNCELSEVGGGTQHCGHFYGGSCHNTEKVPIIELIPKSIVLALLDVQTKELRDKLLQPEYSDEYKMFSAEDVIREILGEV